VVTPQKYWNGIFQLPVALPYCIRAGFGDRRSYNGGVLVNFHTGLDYGVCSSAHPLDIYAAADGVVVFTGLKTVRGMLRLSMTAREFLPATTTNQNSSCPSGITSRPGN